MPSSALAFPEVLAIVSASAHEFEHIPIVLPADDDRRLTWRVRLTLGMLAVGLVAVFAVARWLKPTDAKGQPLQVGAHEQLGLPGCTFYKLTDIPCPSCGMTTSFCHLMHGDLVHSFQANPTGLLLAAGCLAAIPWCVVSAVWGRRLGISNFDRFLSRMAVGIVALMVVVWGIRLIFDI